LVIRIQPTVLIVRTPSRNSYAAAPAPKIRDFDCHELGALPSAIAEVSR
jgi:hypothetical protein